MTRRVRLVLLALSLVGIAAAAATPAQAPQLPYLALGDSVPFGFIAQAGFEYINADNFIGFPNYVGQGLRFKPSNAACPGETTGSFLSSTNADNGCRLYRSQAPLHVPYTSTQLEFALAFLQAHPQTRLVTKKLGIHRNTLRRTIRSLQLDLLSVRPASRRRPPRGQTLEAVTQRATRASAQPR
jgi:hypothetical protein